jgi:hypothetical protein
MFYWIVFAQTLSASKTENKYIIRGIKLKKHNWKFQDFDHEILNFKSWNFQLCFFNSIPLMM